MDYPLTVRTFCASDVGPLTRLLHTSYAELGARGLNYTAVDQDEQVTMRRASAGQCWVVDREGELVGTLTMSLPPSSELQAMTPAAQVPARAWLNQMAVHPSQQGNGIAGDLWTLAKSWAIDVGATSIGVDTAIPAVHLVDLYTRWGFHRCDTVRWYGKTYESVVMEQWLTLGQNERTSAA